MREGVFEEIIPMHGPFRHKMCGKLTPVGYKVISGRVQIRHNTRTHQGWKDVTSCACILSAVLEPEHDGYGRVEITFEDSIGNLKKIIVKTCEAFSPEIAKILRKAGAACTDTDSLRLAEYLRACYDLRVEEARAKEVQ